MQVEMRSITSIRPYDKNPRLNDAAVAAVAASIKEFGFRQPIVIATIVTTRPTHSRCRSSAAGRSRRL